MQWLRKSSNEHPVIELYRNISPLSIVGHGGMGETTLWQLVYEDEMTEEFDLNLWDCVFNDFDLEKIIADMLKSLKMSRPPFDTFYAIQKNLKSEIISKGFLLVLDDLWDEEEELKEQN
ncbi:hypothetical protein KFK09_022284 [Dendrobium nobile]|uniref:NB-ARC domain-containing protein n=1 Tax=Dendrobium nobile TaxID=94219 RepID=A0A8T3AI64_DENNO|nr:hypothetical protein KFK09_022284 [Dendrobium nobile]